MLRRKIAIKNNGGAKSNKERCIVLLLAGSIYDNSNGGVKIVHHRRRNYEYSGSDLRLDTFLWERDLRALSTLFERSGATVWKCAGTSKRCSKRVVLDLIRNFFNYDNVERLRDAYAQTTTFLLYWCGHSDLRTDNWGFSEEGEITCRDLINIWYEAQRRTDDAITIFADTCRSGVWIDELKAARIPNLAYQAACRANEAAFLVYDRKVPRSLLMRRVFREYLSEPSTTRTCTSQHPIYLCDYASSQEEEGGDTESSTLVRGSFRLFTIRL